MNLLDSILDPKGGGGAVAQIAKQLGIPEGVAKQATTALAPALARGLQKNATKPGGLDSLLGALSKGNHEEYVDKPEKLGDEATIKDGNAILGHIFGSKDVSRNVAGSAAQETGIDAAVLKKMLPMLAGVAMGSLSKQTGGGQATGGNPLAMLSGLLDTGKDGSATDDVLNLAKKFL